MARKKKSKAEKSVGAFVDALQRLDDSIQEPLALPSLNDVPPRLQGFSYKYAVLLPLMSAEGASVFTDDHLLPLSRLLTARFGGCLVTSSSVHPPLYGFYQPQGRNPAKDYHTQILVHANPIDAADTFFLELKTILRTAPLIPQEEVLVERYDVRLL